MKKPAELPRIPWFIENFSQGYEAVSYGTTKAAAVAEHKAEYPETASDNIKAYKLK